MGPRTVIFIFLIAGAVALGAIASQGGYFPFFGKMLAQVGLSVGIAPNPYNTLDQQLTQKQQDLNQEQADIDARAAALASTTAAAAAAPGGKLGWTLAFTLAALALFLVALNFYFDWRRGKREQTQPR